MEIEWRDIRDHEAVQKLAKHNPVTERHMQRIAAAKNFRDLEPSANGRAHFLKHEYEGYFALDLGSKTQPARLICKPIGDFKKQGDQFVKESITAFEIVKIEKNYHTH